MKLFKNRYYKDGGESHGSAYFSTLTKALRDQRRFMKRANPEMDRVERDVIEFKPLKKEIIALLNREATHPDNG